MSYKGNADPKIDVSEKTVEQHQLPSIANANGLHATEPKTCPDATNRATSSVLAGSCAPVTVDAADILIPEFTSFDDIFVYIKPWGLWQLVACVTLAFGGMLSAEHVVLHAFVGKVYPHYCEIPLADRHRIPAMLHKNWTEDNFRDFYVPSKPRDDPPQIGETFHPCRRYNYSDWSLFAGAQSFDEALKLRNAVLLNKSNHVSRVEAVSTVPCDGRYHFQVNENEFKGGVQQEFNLVCERDYLLPVGGTINMLGILCGAFLSGPISDRFGRRKAIVYFATGMFFVSVANAFSPVYTIFLTLRYLTGLFEAGAYTSSFVLVMECIGAKYRGPVGFAFCIPWGLGFILLAFCAWLFPFWRSLQLAVALPSGILVVLYFVLVPESPRWLLLHGRYADAAFYIRQAYVRNHGRLCRYKRRTSDNCDNAVETLFTNAEKLENVLRQTPCFSVQTAVVAPDPTTQSSSCSGKWYAVVAKQTKSLLQSYANLFSSRVMAKITICMWFVWIANGVVYYGLSLSSTELKGFSMFINFALSGVVEVPAYLIAMLITSRTRIGRRWLLFVCMLFAGCMLCGIFALQIAETALSKPTTESNTNNNNAGGVNRVQIAIDVLSHAGKFFITASFQMVWIYTSELYPTEIRNIGLGTSSTVCRAFTALSPIIIHLASTMWKLLPTIVFAACALVAAVLCLLPPEMADAALNDTVQQKSNKKLLSAVAVGETPANVCVSRSCSSTAAQITHENDAVFSNNAAVVPTNDMPLKGCAANAHV